MTVMEVLSETVDFTKARLQRICLRCINLTIKLTMPAFTILYSNNQQVCLNNFVCFFFLAIEYLTLKLRLLSVLRLCRAVSV